MLIAKVVGTTVSTIKDEKLVGRKLLIVRQTDEHGEPFGKPFVAVDTVDAGIGDLDVRRVIAVNPQAWPGSQSLALFFQVYYPGVELLSVPAATPEELALKLSSLAKSAADEG